MMLKYKILKGFQNIKINRKMKNLIYLVLIVFLAACGGEKSKEEIRAEINKKKSEINKLNQDIKNLQSQITDSSMQENSIAVRVKEMNGEMFEHYIEAFGETEAVDYAMISPEMGGQIQSIHVEEGSHVNKNQLLVTLNTEPISNQINQVESNLEMAKKTFEKQKRLWEQNIGSEMQYLQAKTNLESLQSQLKSLKAQQRMSQIYAPFDGYVDKVFLKEGELASPGMPVLEFVNLDRLSITANISEEYIGRIHEGQTVEITYESFPDISLDVPIKRKSKILDQQTRTFEIEMEIDNPDEKILPFMISTVSIRDFVADSAFVVPSIIIKRDITGDYVYLVKEDKGYPYASKQYITQGMSYQDKSMIDAGISPNDKVILEGYNLVSTGVPVEIK